MHIDRATIARMLPHRDPIALLASAYFDRPGYSGRAEVRLPGNVPMVAGHVGCTLMQELALEAAAQAVGLMLGSAMPVSDSLARDEQHLLLGFNDVAFEPGFGPPFDDTLAVRVESYEASGDVCSARFWIENCGADVASGQVMVMRGPS